MQITESKLNQLLNNNINNNINNNKLAPIYFLHSDASFIIEQHASLITKIAKTLNYQEHIKIHLDNNTNAEQITQLQTQLFTRSLLAKKQCLTLSCSQFPNDKISKILIDYANKPDNKKILIITCKKLTKAQQNNKLSTALNKHGVCVTIWPPQNHNLPTWVKNQARKYNLTLDQDAIQILIKHTENHLAACDQILQKLALSNNNHITSEHINNICHDQSQHNPFELIDTALSGNITKTQRVLNILKNNKTPMPILTWSAIKSLRLLCQLHQGLKSQNLDALYRKHKVWPKRQPIIYSALQRLDYNKCIRLIRHAYDLELTTKGQADLLNLAGSDALELFLQTIAGLDEKYLLAARKKSNSF